MAVKAIQTLQHFSRVFLLSLLLLVCGLQANAQPPLLRNFEYIETYSVEAVQQMVEFQIPASVIIAQAILESRSGSSDLAMRSNNHFGIKCHIEWGGDTIRQDDDTLSECFRRYSSIQDSYTDHSMFLVSRPRYAELFNLPVTDYKGWCRGLKACGYATFPDYAEVLISIIENFKLYELDQAYYLQPKRLNDPKTAVLQTSRLDLKSVDLTELAKSSLLFTDEKDVHLRSLLHYIRKG